MEAPLVTPEDFREESSDMKETSHYQGVFLHSVHRQTNDVTSAI